MISLFNCLAAASAALALSTPASALHSSAPRWPQDPPPLGPQETSQDGRSSLEDLLNEVEVERARSLEALKPEVARIIEDMDRLRTPVRTSLSDARQKALRSLGPEATPLMLEYLDPGDKPDRGSVFRSELVAEVVAELSSPIITDDLLALARTGNLIARLNALTVLQVSPEPERVVGKIVLIAAGKAAAGLDADQTTTVREAAFAALAALATPEAMAYVQSMLSGSDLARASAALKALQSAPVSTSADAVLSVIKSKSAPRLAEAIATYYGAHQELLEDFDHARHVGEVAVDSSIDSLVRIELFDLLRVNDAKVGTPVKRRIDDYTEVARSDVRNAALLYLARLKDRKARREVLGEFDARIKENKNAMVAYADRAVTLHAIGDYSGATKDWREIMRIMKDAGISNRDKTPFLGIARSLARQKKYREAREYLQQAPISIRERQALAAERDFRDMVDSRYRDAFLLDD